MYLRDKYKPQLLNELEVEYPKIIEYLNSEQKFIINGPKNCGKSTIVKLYLDYLNYDYLLLDEFTINKEEFINKTRFNNKSANSYFENKNFILIIDNFELFNNYIKEYIVKSIKYKCIIITESYLNSKIKYIRFNNLSYNYISIIYLNAYFLEFNKSADIIPEFNNINEMYCHLENINTTLFFDKFEFKYDDFILENDFSKKLYIIDKIKSYKEFQLNFIYNINDIETLDKAYNILSFSFTYFNNHIENFNYYEILSFLGVSQYINKPFKTVKGNIMLKQKNKKDIWLPNNL